MWHLTSIFSTGNIGQFWYILVTDEETDGSELLWVVVIVDGIWGMFCDTEVVKVIFVETPRVVILDIAIGIKMVTVPVFEMEENGIVDCFTVLVECSFVQLEITKP